MSILLAKHINRVLTGQEEITGKVGERIFKNGINTDTGFPFIVYNYSITSTDETKDGCAGDDCSVEVFVFSQDGTEQLELSEHIREALTSQTGEYEEFEVTESTFEGYNDELDEGVYIGISRFIIKTT